MRPALKCHRLLFFGENSLERSCFNSFILKQALKWAWSACLGVERLFKSFLARNGCASILTACDFCGLAAHRLTKGRARALS
jgi:hypothetical protein